MPSPLTPAPRYPGWVSEVVAPLRKFIDDATDPRALYGDLREVGEGESGSVYAARVLRPTASASSSTASLPSTARGKPAYVAIKNVPILPSGSPKLLDLQRELAVTHGLRHNHILAVDAVYVDHVEDALWLRMELMERSLADVIGLGEEGILIQEKQIAQFASDIVHALRYLQAEGIAHRDLRSDNLLINRGGIVKLADFSSAVRVSRAQPTRTDPAGVIFWQAPDIVLQAPEVRTGSYNALKVDVWSLGATIWELAQGEPPFSDVADPRQIGDTLPALAQPEIYSRSFHDFLRSCSQPSKSRPSPDELLNTPFIRNARWRVEVVTLLQQCRAIEERLSKRQSADSDGTVSMS
ncbi:kinase-like protein [Obba rivulosa]|uniref:Kinase-like protein n=1 Tax=Obba rivulosa TaxID=1052685 RepID=A0A8E2DKV3_9APHY|nr:kinase-like protein [Obba rivulosa]